MNSVSTDSLAFSFCKMIIFHNNNNNNASCHGNKYIQVGQQLMIIFHDGSSEKKTKNRNNKNQHFVVERFSFIKRE